MNCAQIQSAIDVFFDYTLLSQLHMLHILRNKARIRVLLLHSTSLDCTIVVQIVATMTCSVETNIYANIVPFLRQRNHLDYLALTQLCAQTVGRLEQHVLLATDRLKLLLLLHPESLQCHTCQLLYLHHHLLLQCLFLLFLLYLLYLFNNNTKYTDNMLYR